MRRKFEIVLLFAFSNCVLLASPSPSAAGNPQLTVSVYNYAQVQDGALNRAEQQATNVFIRAGLNIRLLDCTHRNTAVCNETGGPDHLFLLITPKVANSISSSAFGVAFVGSVQAGRYADVFWNRVQEIQTSSKVDVALILGSVMAHEIGHLLLGSNSHAVNGIMRAHWQDSELRRMCMGTFLFLPEQEKRMRAKVEQWKELLMASREACNRTAN